MGNCLGRCLSGKNSFRRSTDGQEGEELVSEEENAGDKFIIFKIMKFKKKKRPQFIEQFWDRKHNNDYSQMNQGASVADFENSEIQLQNLDAQKLLITTARNPEQQIKFENCFQNNTNGYHHQHHLINNVASSSRASSSLDLEWEHEYSAAIANIENLKKNQEQSWLFLPEELSSRIISANYNDRNNDNNYDNFSEKQSNFSSTNYLLGSQNNISFIKQNSSGLNYLNQVQQQINHNNQNNSSSRVIRTPSRTSWSHISTPESLEWDIDEEQQKQLHVEDDNLDHETLELLHDIELLKNKVLNETGDGLEIAFKNS